jgi:hypothetical protein
LVCFHQEKSGNSDRRQANASQNETAISKQIFENVFGSDDDDCGPTVWVHLEHDSALFQVVITADFISGVLHKTSYQAGAESGLSTHLCSIL